MIYALYVKKPLKAGYYCNLRFFSAMYLNLKHPQKGIFLANGNNFQVLVHSKSGQRGVEQNDSNKFNGKIRDFGQK